MRFDITHLTRFRYSRPAFLEPHTLRLRPRADRAQHPLEFRLEIDPPPAGRVEFDDPEGNLATRIWFDDLIDTLTIRTAAAVETLRANPFDYVVVDPDDLAVPVPYPPGARAALARFLSPSGDAAAAALSRRILDGTGPRIEPFLQSLTDVIYREIAQEVRDRGDPMPPGETIERRRGSCRDMVVLFLEACRAAGVAARFVSGYQEGDPEHAERHLHAWAEIYLPGAGWRGYDPTNGLAVADRHVALAAGPSPRDAAPTEGTFRGTGVRAHLETHIELTVAG